MAGEDRREVETHTQEESTMTGEHREQGEVETPTMSHPSIQTPVWIFLALA